MNIVSHNMKKPYYNNKIYGHSFIPKSLLNNLSSILVKYMTNEYCKSIELIVIKKIGILLATIRAFNYSQNWKYQAYK